MEEFDPIQKLQEWGIVKAELQTEASSVLFKEGEVWWANVGMNLGEEIFGKGDRFKRPVLVFRKITKNLFLGLPITSQERNGDWYVPIVLPGRPRWAMLHQVKVFDKKRLVQRLGTLKELDLENIHERFRAFYCPQKIVTPPPNEEAGISG